MIFVPQISYKKSMNQKIKEDCTINEVRRILESEPPMLFLGAGFSVGSTNEYGDIPLGKDLKKEILERFIQENVTESDLEEIKQYDLPDVCEYVDDSLGKYEELRHFLVERLRSTVPAEFHYNLPIYPWKKIYTVNIDDLVEHVYNKKHQKLLIQNQPSQKRGSSDLEYIKLHGCVNGAYNDLIFSRKEYSNLISERMNFKLNDLGHDIQNENFVFIGASMDETDIDHYIMMYEHAGYFRKGKMIFVDPYPTIKFRNRVKAFSGILLEWTTEKFMDFLRTIRYNPGEQEKCIKRMSYSGIYLYSDIIESLPLKEVYESNLYDGYNCEWRDVLDDWLFEGPYFEKLKEEIRQIDYTKSNTYCIALYGKGLAGKGCLLKQIGVWLNREGYTVLEFKGKSFDQGKLFDFMRGDKGEQYALLMEDASFNYKVIEDMYAKNNTGKRLVVITTSRNYYHFRKKYYLEGNPYEELEIDDKLDLDYAKIIYKKLASKGYLGSLSRNDQEGYVQILREKILSNVFTTITYGKNFRKRIQDSINNLMEDYSEQSMRLFKELTLFEQVDLPYYPNEMLTARYSIDFNCFHTAGTGKLSPSEAAIVDFVRFDTEGITLKNAILLKQIWKQTSLDEKKEMILGILRYIAPYFSEHDNNYWRVIFESLLKEDVLEGIMGFRLKDIVNLYYQLKENYSGISYYWMQMGLAEQKRKDFSKALNHLEMARNIRPHAYQIQHAIARNYLKQANYTNSHVEAEALFKIGEEKMFELINSQEYHKNKARNYSIHCYAIEKVRYLKKYGTQISNEDVRKIKRLIDTILNIDDDYIESLLREYMLLLKEKNKLGAINFKPGDRYWKALNQKNMLAVSEEMDDIVIESY